MKLTSPDLVREKQMGRKGHTEIRDQLIALQGTKLEDEMASLWWYIKEDCE